MKLPCDEAIIESGDSVAPCIKAAEPWVLAATILGSSMAFIDSTVVNVAMPALQKSFGGTIIDLQWVIESYALFLSALILVGGSAGDLYGRRRMFLSGVAVFAIASTACGFASSVHQLIVARAIQGIGAAFLVPGSLSIISSSFSEKERGPAIGTWSGFTAITTAIGPVLGGWLVEHASWRWVFFINLPIAVAVVVLSLWRVPESRMPADVGLDWAGALMATVGLAGITYGFILSSALSWSSPSVWAPLALGAACLLAFLPVEARARAPMVPLNLFQSRDFAGANLVTLFLYGALGIFFFLYPLNLIQAQHYSATATGAAALPFILVVFLLSRWSGGLITRYGAKLPLIVGPLIAAAGFLLFTRSSEGGSYWTTFFPAFLVLGFGMAVSVAPLTTVVMSAVAEERAGTASGVNNAVARVASLLAVAILGMVMLGAFSQQIDRSLIRLSLPADVAQVVRTNEVRLHALPIPAGLDSAKAAALKIAIDRAFLFAFRLIMLICAFLAVMSSVFAARNITGGSTSAGLDTH